MTTLASGGALGLALGLALAILLLACSDSAAVVEGATVGDTLDAAGTQRVTLLEAEVGFGGTGTRPPPEGSVHASFLFRFESISSDARYDSFRFAVTAEDGVAHPYTADGRQPALGSSSSLPTGEVVEGWVSFVVPDDFESLAVTYDPPFAQAGATITFVVRAPEQAEE